VGPRGGLDTVKKKNSIAHAGNQIPVWFCSPVTILTELLELSTKCARFRVDEALLPYSSYEAGIILI
jgi:hypothetical protein